MYTHNSFPQLDQKSKAIIMPNLGSLNTEYDLDIEIRIHKKKAYQNKYVDYFSNSL